MTIESNYLFMACMDVDADKEEVFHDVYNSEHIPLLREVPGVISIARFQREEFTLIIGGERRTVRLDNEPQHAAIYEIESPAVLASEAWAKAVDSGRWPEHVRPYTRNRRHLLMKRIFPK